MVQGMNGPENESSFVYGNECSRKRIVLNECPTFGIVMGKSRAFCCSFIFDLPMGLVHRFWCFVGPHTSIFTDSEFTEFFTSDLCDN